MRTIILSSLALLAFGLASCSTAPSTPSGRDALRDDGDRTLASMKQNDSGLDNLLNNSYGYAILPSIGEGGAGIGGAYGKGVVYHQGKFAGYTDMSQGSIGAELGGQTYAELVVFQNQDAYWRLESGKMSFGAEASAIALKAGAAAQSQFVHG